MTLTITSEAAAGIVKITLAGHLNAANAPEFQREIEKAAALPPTAVVLLLGELEYMSSAGLRIILFGKQKMGPKVKIYAVAPLAEVRETIRLSGFHHALTFLETYDASVIEA
ncbi:MAG: anti-sigma factor antagonist [Terrimicrobiaceae bacterium]|nr:anti-sigma factor antagonist [Terrimicrobiaceae bacterium]